MCDILFDDRTFIEICCDEMCSRSDDLHTLIEGLVIRLGSLETWQEGMMDIDDLSLMLAAESRREDLHEPCKDDEVDLLFFDQRRDLGFALLSSRRGEVDFLEGDSMTFDQSLQIRVIGDDDRDFNRQFTDLMEIEEISQAVALLRDSNKRTLSR